jgi:hypothetical protein
MKKYKVRVTAKPNGYYQTGGQQTPPVDNPSVYDYLAEHGQAKNAGYNARKAIAQNLGIENYRGTAEQNLQMLEMLKKTQDLNTLMAAQQPVAQEGPVVTPIRNVRSTPNTLPKATAPETPQEQEESSWSQYLPIVSQYIPMGIAGSALAGLGTASYLYNNANKTAATQVGKAAKQAGARVVIDPFKRAEQIAESIRTRGNYTAGEMAELKKIHNEVDLGKMIENVKAGFKRVTPASVAGRSAANQAYEQAYQEAKGLWPVIKDGFAAAKATPLFKFLRHLQEGGQNEDSVLEDIAEVFDPTGITAWDDAYRAYNDPNMPGWEKGLVMASALPLIGKAGKGAKAVVNIGKFAKAKNIAGKIHNIITPIAQSDKYLNPASQFVQHVTGTGMKHAPELLQNFIPGLLNSNNQIRRFNTAYDMITRQFGGDLGEMAYGGQYGHSLDLGSRVIDNEMGKPDPYAVKDTLQAVPRDMANLEAERGETAYGDLDGDGEMEHSKIGGKRHSQGGTPLNLKPGTFIYSDTKSMKLKGQALAQFGKSVTTKKGYTPAELAKQYELNKYKAILEDPNADQYQKRTAEMMMNNNKFKLAQLALAQESKKGFPQGIPQAAMMALPPELVEQLRGMQEQPGMEQEPEAAEYAKKGGSTFSGNAWYQQGGIHIDPAKKGTFKAQATRMGMGTQEAAAHILANKDQYSPEMVKKAVFAHNFAKEEGGLIEYQKRGEVRGFQSWPGDRYSGVKNASKFPSSSWDEYAKSIGYTGTPGDNLALQKYIMQDPKRAARINELHKQYGKPIGGMYDSKLGYRWDQFKNEELKKQQYTNPYFPSDINPNEEFQLPPEVAQNNVPAGYVRDEDYVPAAKDVAEDTQPTGPTAGSAGAGYNPKNARMMRPDKAAILQSLITRAGIPTMSPFVQAPDYVLPETVFADPTRQYAALAEQANMQNQGLRTFGRPQSYLAGSSQIAGKQLEGIANIDAATNAQNVGIANQANAVNAATINQNLAQKAQAANMLAEMSNKYNLENFSMRDAAEKQTLAAYQNAFGNRAKLDALNKTSEYFDIDPRTGFQVLKPGVDISQLIMSGKGSSNTDPYAAIAEQIKKGMDAGLSKEDASKFAMEMLKGNRTTSTYGANGSLSKTQRQMLSGLSSLLGPMGGAYGASAYPFNYYGED